MLGTEKAKRLINNSDFSDSEVELLRDQAYSMAEIIYTDWINRKENEDEKRKKAITESEDKRVRKSN